MEQVSTYLGFGDSLHVAGQVVDLHLHLALLLQLLLDLCRLSSCSPSSATLSACLRRAAAVARGCRVASSRSLRIFLELGLRSLVHLNLGGSGSASSSRSLISSSSRERSERACFGAGGPLGLDLLLQLLDAGLVWGVAHCELRCSLVILP